MYRFSTFFILIVLALTLGCQSTNNGETKSDPTASEPRSEPETESESQAEVKRKGISTTPQQLAPAKMAIATFAGGCFWCMEYPFESIPGVKEVYSGYTAGPEENPTYKQVAGGQTGHTEAVRVVYNPDVVSYDLLLKVFWRNINPTQKDGQFVDRGAQYRSGIYWHDEAQKKAALESKARIAEKFDDPIQTEIEEAGPFYAAEDYHQNFYEKSKAHYQRYRKGSGRDEYLEEVWGEEAGGYSLHPGEKK